ncbi:unnamed protein product, partial [Candidula unifasciata]
INIPSNTAASDYVVHVDHTRHLFRFGTGARSDFIIHEDYQQYRNVLYSLFNSVTLHQFSWFRDQGTASDPNHSRDVNATEELTKNGVEILGESLFSARPASEPMWVANLHSAELRDAVTIRLNYLTGITKGKVHRWIVNNQLLHGRFYEDRLGDKNFSPQLFKTVRAADPYPDLLLNDLDVVATGNHNL